MARFSTHKLNNSDGQGSFLAKQRQSKGLSIEKASRDLGISGRYLQALEQGRWYDLPFGSYGKMFLKKYSQFLGLDQNSLDTETVLPVSLFVNQSKNFTSQRSSNISWHKSRLFLLFMAGAGILVYLLAGAWLAIVPPRFSLVEPVGDFTTSQPTVVVTGSTQAGTLIFINNQPLVVSEEGLFRAVVPLQPGLNNLLVEAQKSYGQRTGLTRRVMFKPDSTVGLPLQIF
ncbi:helix-turn-helix domain-containing protein [Patescibacteria group bacterium]|nr:helix-turn-helix domain-containing protein [Patescibacteria group bacterium]